MSYTFPFNQNDKVIELGGGNRPYFRPNLDVRSGENIDIVADFNEPLPLKDNDYDGVFSCYCIEHLSWRKVRLFIAEVFRILKKNGKAVFITANTERQMKYVLNHDEWNDDCSCIIFGDQDYPENSHRNSLCPRYAIKLLTEAGFSNVVVLPHGALGTDMIIEAEKTTGEMKFDREYFDNPLYYGDPSQGMYRDHPKNWIIYNNILAENPNSILELGCGRGYLLRRFEVAGIPCKGLDISHHCYLTRVTDSVIEFDARKTPWPFENNQFDLCLSQGFFDLIEPQYIPNILSEINRVCARGLHGIDLSKFSIGAERQNFINNSDFELGHLAHNIPVGDGKLKLNIGTFIVMSHFGWINTDIINLTSYAEQNQFKFLPVDSTKPLPFDSDTVDLIASSHMLEHLDINEGRSFLAECYRIMKKGAVMRIAVPDAQKLISLYNQGKLEYLDEMNLNAASTPCQTFKLWSFLIDGHKTTYDFDSMNYLGSSVGFSVALKSFNSGHEQIIKEVADYLPEISLYVEMTKS